MIPLDSLIPGMVKRLDANVFFYSDINLQVFYICAFVSYSDLILKHAIKRFGGECNKHRFGDECNKPIL